MAVTMKDVRRVLDPEEPKYSEAAALGPEALPHLRKLVAGPDPQLAAKAAYAASMLEGDAGAEVVAAAARSEEAIVRVAAASAARNLPGAAAGSVLRELVQDEDSGVRKVARSSVPPDADEDVREMARSAPGDVDESGGAAIDPRYLDNPMPGQRQASPSEMPGQSGGGGLMPGEASGSAGHANPSGKNPSGKMPGEA